MPRLRTHPGEVLAEEYLHPLGLSASALARPWRSCANRIATSSQAAGRIADTAIRLGEFFTVDLRFWLNLQTGLRLVGVAEHEHDYSNVRPRSEEPAAGNHDNDVRSSAALGGLQEIRSVSSHFTPCQVRQDREQVAEHEARDSLVAPFGEVDDVEIEVVVRTPSTPAAMSMRGAPSSRAMSLTMRLCASLADNIVDRLEHGAIEVLDFARARLVDRHG